MGSHTWLNPGDWLNPGEEIVVELRPHWSFLAGPVLAVVVVLAGAVTAASQGAPRVLDGIVGILVMATLVWLVVRYSRWSATVLVLTGDRLVQRSGFLSRRVREVPLAQVSEVDCRRRVRDRVIGTGRVVVTPVGAPPEVFDHVPRPTAIVRQLHRQTDLQRRRGWAGTGLSVPEQLERLDDLRRRGALSQTEFDDHKARLLQRW